MEGLNALRAAGANAPEPYACGDSFIEMEELDIGARPDWPALARMVAKLHRNTCSRFGWKADNWIGPASQKNAWSGDWPGFFLDCRLEPQLEKAGMNTPFRSLDKFFESRVEATLGLLRDAL